MKSNRRYFIALASLILVLVMMVSLASCGLLTLPTTDEGGNPTDSRPSAPEPIDDTENTGAYVTDVRVVEGQIVVAMSDGTVKNIGAANTTIQNNSITVNGTADNGVNATAASTALLSTVGVQCGFSVTQYVSSGGIFGGYTTREVIQYGYGSGVIYRLDKTKGDAYIITNYHVVFHEDSNDPNGISERISVYMLGDSERMNATFVGGSDQYDIAVLRVEDSPRLAVSAAQAVKISETPVTVGEPTLIAGNANGDGISVTEGIVSVDSEEITMAAIRDNTRKDTFRVIRSDASVNPGNSGGGMFNASAELIGIVNAKTVDESTEGMGYAIPVDVAVTIAEKVIDGDMDVSGTTRRVMLGVTLTLTDSRMAYEPETGLVRIEETVVVAQDTAATDSSSAVIGVMAGSLGEKAGLKSGDVIRSVTVGDHDLREVTRRFHLIDEVLKAREGDTITIVVERAGTQVILSVDVPTGYHG